MTYGAAVNAYPDFEYLTIRSLESNGFIVRRGIWQIIVNMLYSVTTATIAERTRNRSGVCVFYKHSNKRRRNLEFPRRREP